MADWLDIVGRLLLGSLYVIGGIRHFFILPAVTGLVASRGLPFPRVGVILVSLFEIACGLLLVAGVLVIPSAAGLVVFTLAASVIALNFWDQGGEQRQLSISMWMTNVALVGGLVLAAAASL